MSLFRLDASIRGEQSVSRKVADTATDAWLEVHPHAPVVRRDLGAHPLPSDLWPHAVGGSFLPEDARSPEQRDALALAATLADELVAADAYVFALPLYNWGVDQHVKTWIDLVLTDPRFRAGTPSPIAGRPAALVVTRGGGYSEGMPKHGWDHATPYYLRVLGDVFALDVHVSEVELTLAGLNPAMAELIPLAEKSLRDGHESAGRHGAVLAERVAGVTRLAG
ncbi:FMN-dependent NADH-azoreductase [Motilibacter peucedani]|uniref:FMN dependent NADH:quinone oxidoreductase n=1 Tax=Motilibacter peucedani TaxID=598650 RepID=A0A420XM81_9ACTN|nr:NAD(P)H-dependent oxidoreductase [Motilibacter peucedani]RKS72479.1 FMN-dependent NADH-azoreductase [Motilibacter peucedani]